MGCCGTPFDLEQWLAQVEEDAIEPEIEIIDAHQHFYDCGSEPRGDLSLVNKLTSCMNRAQKESLLKLVFPAPGLQMFGIHNLISDSYSPEDLMKDAQGHNVTKSVCVEFQYKDTKAKKPQLQQVAASSLSLEKSKTNEFGIPNAHVCHVDLRLGKEKVAEALKQHVEANPNVRGLRHQLAWHPSKTVFSSRDGGKGLLSDPDFKAALTALAEFDLVFDAWIFHTQLPEFTAVVQELSGQRFVLDHIGSPLGMGIYADKVDQVKEEWEASMKELAKCPNVSVKLSGILMPHTGIGRFNLRKSPPTSDEVVAVVLPYFRFVIEQFGVDRCMFGSNFPVDKVSCSYRVLFNAYKKICNEMGLSAEDKKKLFHDNVVKVYKLP